MAALQGLDHAAAVQQHPHVALRDAEDAAHLGAVEHGGGNAGDEDRIGAARTDVGEDPAGPALKALFAEFEKRNPNIKVVVRIFDEDFAHALQDQFGFIALSATEMAAPVFAAAASGADVTNPISVEGELLSLARFTIAADSELNGQTVGQVEDGLKDHLDKANKAPHPDCPVHGVKFDEMIKAITEVKATVTLLDVRIYDFMRSNGYHDRDQV